MVEGRREGRKEWLSKGEKKGRIEEGRERKKEGRNSFASARGAITRPFSVYN